jgi:hypothetical protein
VTIADPPALRMRRSRAHKGGDHSLCRSACATVKLAAPLPDVTPATDPKAEMQALAGLLAQAYKSDPGNASLARELRMTLQALMGPGDAVDPALAEILSAFR